MADKSSDNFPDARRLVELDKSYVWHPFTPMRQWRADEDDTGRVIVAAEGFELIDSAGRRFIDGFGSLWCNLHGHRVPAIDRAIRDQLDRVAHTTLLGYGSPPSIQLAEKLVRITPAGLKKVFYSDSGATAVEVALKMAYQFYYNRGEKRRRFLALKNSYHGDTIGSVSLGGMETFHKIFAPLLFETTFVDSPNPYHHPVGDAAAEAVCRQIEQRLAASPGEYCAMILEPLMQGAAGMLNHPAGFLKSVRKITRDHGVLLIVDEVATGFCRTGKLFACEHEGVSPDLMCLGKGLTGGYLPVAATLATQEIFDEFCGDLSAGRTFYHGHTFTGNALGCAAAVASIDLIESSGLVGRLPAKADLIHRRLAELADHPNVGDIRQCGMMVGIELVASREPDRAFDADLRTGAAVCFAARNRGVIIRPLGDVVVLMPAPAMDTETLDRLLTATIETIR
jgi:adenosylmethionine-8-amino-7-oxononanoate aminotransferase